MNLTIPRFALAVAERRGLDAVLVRSRRGQVAHVVEAAVGTRLLTRTERLRRSARPVCGTRGRGFRQLHVPEVRLCSFCTAHVLRDSQQRDWQQLGRLDFLWALRHATSRMELQVAVKTLREARLQFQPYPLSDGTGTVSLMYVLHHSRAWLEYAA
jgi:hypothetical protein